MNTRVNLVASTEEFSESNSCAENTLRSLAFLFLLAAIMSQSAMAYYAAAYYDQHNNKMERVSLFNFKFHDHQKSITDIRLSDIGELLMFKCDK